MDINTVLAKIFPHTSNLFLVKIFNLDKTENIGSIKCDDDALSFELFGFIFICQIFTKMVNIYHLLENGVLVMEKLGMQSDFMVESLCDIGDISIFEGNDVILFVSFVIMLNRLHIAEVSTTLYEANKHDLIANEWVNLD